MTEEKLDCNHVEIHTAEIILMRMNKNLQKIYLDYFNMYTFKDTFFYVAIKAICDTEQYDYDTTINHENVMKYMHDVIKG